MSALKTLCFTAVLVSIQVHGGATNRAPESFENFDSRAKLSDVSFRRRQLTQSQAPAPESAPSSDEAKPSHEEQINEAIAKCEKNPGEPWDWMFGIRVKGTNKRISRKITQDICCCVCQCVPDCVAVHYEYDPDACILHFGGTPEAVFSILVRRVWIKPGNGR